MSFKRFNFGSFTFLLMLGGALLSLIGLAVLVAPHGTLSNFDVFKFTSKLASLQIILLGLAVLFRLTNQEKLLQFTGVAVISICLYVFSEYSNGIEILWGVSTSEITDAMTWRLAPLSLICLILFGLGSLILGRKSLNDFVKFSGYLFISLPTAIGFSMSLSKIFVNDELFKWSSPEFMSTPVALALTLSGFIIFCDIFRKETYRRRKQLFLIPISLSFMIFIASIYAWYFSLDLQSQKIKFAVENETQFFKSVTSVKLDEYGKSLKRMANRIENDNVKNLRLHLADARAYVFHLRGMKSIGIFRGKSTVKWLFKDKSSLYIPDIVKTFSLLKNSSTNEDFYLSNFFSNESKSLFLISSDFRGRDNIDYKLFAIVDVDEFFTSVVNEADFGVLILSGNDTVFKKVLEEHQTTKWKARDEFFFKGMRASIETSASRNLLNSEVSYVPTIVIVVGCFVGVALSLIFFAGLKAQDEKLNRISAEKKFTDWQRAMLESAAYSIISIDIAGIIQTFNPTAEKLLGYQASDLVGRESPAVFHTPDEVVARAEELTKELGILIKPGFDVFVARTNLLGVVDEHEWTYVHRNGSKIPVSLSVTALRNETSEVTGYLGIAQDLTEKKRAFNELQKITNQLTTLVNGSSVGILSMDSELKIQSWNPACEKIFGWTDEESIGGYPPFVPIEKLPQSLELVEKLRSSLEPIKVVNERIRKDGRSIFVESSASPLKNSSGELDGILVVIIDVTEKILLEKNLISKNLELEKSVEHSLKLQQAAIMASRSKSEFLANMSHEIRTPINGIIGMASLLQDTKLESRQVEFVESIHYSADSLLTIINDILDFSKVEAGKLDIEINDFILSEVLHETMKMFEFMGKKKNLKITLCQNFQIPYFLKGDAGRLRQVITNLVGNAIKFTSEGEVTLSVSEKAPGVYLFEVQDQGIGISDEARSRLFQPFEQADSSTTRKFGGTGLGLSISKRLVNLMGGEIGVESELGKGAKFYFELPFSRGDLIIRENKEKINSPVVDLDFSPFRVLVAEDNLINQRVILLQLEKLGLKADAVASGIEVLESVRISSYDLILMDCQMPEMDGYEATRSIRGLSNEQLANLPIIALTANALNGDKERCLAAGMNDYLTKPINLKELRQALNRHLLGRGDEGKNQKVIQTKIPATINWEVVHELESLGDNDQGVNFLVEFYEAFKSESDVKISLIRASLDDGNFQEIKRLTHMLKATCGNIGATNLSLICSKVEGHSENDKSFVQSLVFEYDKERIQFVLDMNLYLLNKKATG